MSEYYYEERSDRIYHKKYLINRSACTTLLDGYEVCKKLNALERQLEEARELCEQMLKSITGESRHKRDAVDFTEQLDKLKEQG